MRRNRNSNSDGHTGSCSLLGTYFVRPIICHITDPLNSLQGGPDPHFTDGKREAEEVTSDPSCTSSGSRKPLGIPGKPIPLNSATGP